MPVNALKYFCMILLSVFVSCDSDDDDNHDEPNWVHNLPQQQYQPQQQDVYLTPQKSPFVQHAS